jgi:hypothetical protein
MLKNIHRVGPGGNATIVPTTFSSEHKHWLPDSSAASDKPIDTVLKPYLLPQKENFNITFGLSGGLDSRVLLALYAEQRNSIALHLFGHPEDADIQIAKQIAREEGLRQAYYHKPIPSANELLTTLPEYVGQVCLVAPVSSYLKLRYYPQLHSENKIIIDGAWGEILRRQLFIRLGLRGKKGVLTGDPRQIYNHVKFEHASIFTKDITKQMKQGFENQIAGLWQEMPEISEIGFENFIDLFAICTHLPNDSGPEQSRMDSEILSYMPYIQPSFLDVVFQVPIYLKRNGKLSRQLIRKYWASLTKYPLVKAGITYPFSLSRIPAVLWMKTKSKLWGGYHDLLQLEFLRHMSEFIHDTIHSTEVKTFPAYDHRAIVDLVDQFYLGKKELASKLDWFLTFELWRRCMNINGVD